MSLDSEEAKTAAPKKKGKAAEPPVEEVVDEPEAVVAEEPELVDEPVAEAEETIEEPVVEAEAEEEIPVEAVDEQPFAEADADEEVSEEPEPADAFEEPETAEAAEEEPELDEPAARAAAKAAPGFSKLLDSLAGLTGFYGSQPVKIEPVLPEPELQVEEEFG